MTTLAPPPAQATAGGSPEARAAAATSFADQVTAAFTATGIIYVEAAHGDPAAIAALGLAETADKMLLSAVETHAQVEDLRSKLA